MSYRIRLKAHPHKYVAKARTRLSLVCDHERRSHHIKGWHDTRPFTHAHWFALVSYANTWADVSQLKRSLTLAGVVGLKWYETTWAAYEVVSVETGGVESLDTFLLKGRNRPYPIFGDLEAFAATKAAFDAPKVPPPVQAAIDLIPSSVVQRQDSLSDQMVTVLELARRAGCYDAYDHITKQVQT